ncbi:MAG: hypothetical protein NC395_03580 [Prevotella sp.]|nr:hypothetical protein [Prevotella sp.]
MIAIHNIDSYIPTVFLKILKKLSGNNIKTVNDLAKLIANCFLPYPISKKLFVIETENEQDVLTVKKFISSILRSNSSECEIINENFDYTINEFCSTEMLNQLNSLRFSNIKAIFLNRSEHNLSSGQAEIMSKLINNTSNNTNHKVVNNIQPILFQSDPCTDDLRNEDIIVIDLSDEQLEEITESIPEYDLTWARIYFTLYGYLLIKNRVKFASQDKLEIPKDQLTEKILKEFISKCFVSPEEAQKRVKPRKESIANLKRENPLITTDELTAALINVPLHFTFRDEFLKYIQKFIETQYDAATIEKYKINSKLLLNEFRKNKQYSQLYEFKNVQAQYIYHKKGSAFVNLSLKKPWHILEKELESQNVNMITSNANENNIDLQLYDTIKKEIDFSQVPFHKLDVRLEIT